MQYFLFAWPKSLSTLFAQFLAQCNTETWKFFIPSLGTGVCTCVQLRLDPLVDFQKMRKETRHEYFWLSAEYFLQKNVSWTTKWHFFCFVRDAFLPSLPSDLQLQLLWKSCPKPRGWTGKGAAQEETLRRHKIWPATPAAKKTAVTKRLGKHSRRGVMLWAARDGRRLMAGSLGRGRGEIWVWGYGALVVEKGLWNKKLWQSSGDISSLR